jgi:hypothetical protein
MDTLNADDLAIPLEKTCRVGRQTGQIGTLVKNKRMDLLEVDI